MQTSELLFLFFGLMVVLPVLYLIFTKNIIRAIFSVALTFLGIAALYVLLNAEYLAVVQILIYAGGMIVLLIFGVMLSKRVGDQGIFTGHRGVFAGALVFIFFLTLLFKLIYTSQNNWSREPAGLPDQVKQIGVLFLTDHLIAFELVAFILLVALVGAAFLAKKSGDI